MTTDTLAAFERTALVIERITRGSTTIVWEEELAADPTLRTLAEEMVAACRPGDRVVEHRGDLLAVRTPAS
jgi:hypothetical protein